jgi:hypothetical protein
MEFLNSHFVSKYLSDAMGNKGLKRLPKSVRLLTSVQFDMNGTIFMTADFMTDFDSVFFLFFCAKIKN